MLQTHKFDQICKFVQVLNNQFGHSLYRSAPLPGNGSMTKMCTSTWVEFEESGELQKVYLQREDHVETKRVSHGKTLKNLTASPGDPLSSAPASVADSTPKPDAEQEVQASDMEISIIISLSLELGCLRNLWMLMMPHNLLFDRNRLF
jgi:hypothetical protein